jgi:hypothetical protein
MEKKYLDCLCLLRNVYDILEILGWEFDFLSQVKKIFKIYKDKFKKDEYTRNDVKALESYMLCINTFDKDKIYNRNLKIIKKYE